MPTDGRRPFDRFLVNNVEQRRKRRRRKRRRFESKKSSEKHFFDNLLWTWSSGQRACLVLRQSEIESH